MSAELLNPSWRRPQTPVISGENRRREVFIPGIFHSVVLMPTDGNGPTKAADFEDVQHAGWTAANALLNAQETGNRALEDYLLMMNYHRIGSLETEDIETLIADAIDAHAEIIEDLELARDALDTLADAPAETA